LTDCADADVAARPANTPNSNEIIFIKIAPGFAQSTQKAFPN
jgi:hypothetical protein